MLIKILINKTFRLHKNKIGVIKDILMACLSAKKRKTVLVPGPGTPEAVIPRMALKLAFWCSYPSSAVI